ncbi:MAG: hypothetical protein KUG78_01180 [Kangiellaceae bacterium]|nr:hypothetical protein [Kangiellaceae bacterium]
MKFKSYLPLLIAAGAMQLTACGGSSSSDPEPDPEPVSVIDIAKVQDVLATNADIALAAYEDSVDTAVLLQTALATFEADPTQDNLDAAKIAWLVSREPYGQTEVYRFRLSPIDSSDYSSEDGLEGDINAWPLGEALIDYVTTGSDFGDDQVGVTDHSTGVEAPVPTNNIINSIAIAIDADLLANTATADDEHDVIAGYHAIEFLLWGQDLNLDTSADTEASREMSTTGNILNSGGHRPLTDFTTDDFADRRHTYLEVAAAKLVADLEEVRDGWMAGANYRTAFVAVADEAEARVKLAEMLTGMGTLSEGELAGERMQIAFSSNSQEDEHSCFSDNTHRDIYLNAEGVSNSFYGEYAGYDSTLDGQDDAVTRAVSGYGLDDYLTDVELTARMSEMTAALDATETDTLAIDNSARVDGVPVDNLIMDVNRNSDNPMYAAIISLNAQSGVIANIATDLGITSSVVDDDGSACDTTDPTTTCDG